MTYVLVIDDDDNIREFVAYALADEGYHVEQASDGGIALELIARKHPDVILLDMRMPNVDGWQFTQIYRERYRHRTQAPIIVMTAARDAAQRATDINAASYISKPFDLDVLITKVSSIRSLGTG